MSHKAEVRALEIKARDLQARICRLDQRIVRLKNNRRPVFRKARIHTEQCRGCGICKNSCPVGAIAVDTVARVDENRCIGCGLCVNVCPRGAIFLSPPVIPGSVGLS